MLPFIYPPFAALVLVPLAVVPWVVASVSLLVLSTISLLITLYVVARRLWPATGRRSTLFLAAIALLASFALEPVLQTIQFGQINLALMALVTLDCLVERSRWPRGLLVGIAAAIKLTPAAFVVYFLLRRDYRAATTAAVSGAAATVIGFLVLPGPSVRFWLDNPTHGVSGSPFFTNQTFLAVLVRAGVDGVPLTASWLLLSIGLLTLAVPAIRRGSAPQSAPLALVATAGVALLVSPTSWSHHWVWVAPALLVAGANAWRYRLTWWFGVTAALPAVFVIAPHQHAVPRAVDGGLPWSPLQQIVGSTYVWFTMLLYVVLWVALRSWCDALVDQHSDQVADAVANDQRRPDP